MDPNNTAMLKKGLFWKTKKMAKNVGEQSIDFNVSYEHKRLPRAKSNLLLAIVVDGSAPVLAVDTNIILIAMVTKQRFSLNKYL